MRVPSASSSSTATLTLAHSVQEMRAASKASGGTGADTSTLSGKVRAVALGSTGRLSTAHAQAEDALGKAVGCEGMQDTETSATQVGQEDRYATTHGEH